MKVRLDKLLVERSLVETRSKAVAIIMAGNVSVNGKPVTKAGTEVSDEAEITIKEEMPWVSRGALKLEAALDAFDIKLESKVAVDVGASTGGFTDMMLSRGVQRVYALDVGHGQLHYRLRGDKRVINHEGVNVRALDPGLIPEPCDVATFDVSFISLKLVVPPVLQILKPRADIIMLVKPQFEAGRAQVRKGIVRDESVTAEVLEDITVFCTNHGLQVRGHIPSPIKGAKGNQEHLLYAVMGGGHEDNHSP